MRGMNSKGSRLTALVALALGAVALLAVSGIASAKDRHGDDNGAHHGRHHGHHHLQEVREAGTISTFDATTGKLTLALKGGESVTGLVTTETRIDCEGVDNRLTRRDHGGGDNSGPGSSGNEPGDDNGGHGNEPGDDNGGQGQEPGDDNGGQGEEPGDDNGGEETAPMPNPGQAPASCEVGSLSPGTFVGDAELRLGTGSAVFTEIELGHHS